MQWVNDWAQLVSTRTNARAFNESVNDCDFLWGVIIGQNEQWRGEVETMSPARLSFETRQSPKEIAVEGRRSGCRGG